MKAQPFFSIVIPTYNRADLLRYCLDSLVAQTYTNWEAIIIDNYSVDNNEQVAASYGDKRIRFYKNANEGIIAVSRNKALSLAEGDVICFLDSDDIWTSDKLEKVMPYLDRYDMVYHDMIIYHDQDGKITYDKPLKGRKLKNNQYMDALLDGNPCINSSLVVKRSVLEKIGTISEERELIGVEDFDYVLRMLQVASSTHIPEVLGYYYVGQSSVSNTDRQVQRMEALYARHLADIKDDLLKKEIRCRLAYRQGRIYQIHGNRKEAATKLAASLKSRSPYYVLRSLLFYLLTKF